MLLICEKKTIDLSKFETVSCRKSFMGDGFPVEATRHEPGLLGTSLITEEIVRMEDEKDADALVEAITKKWVEKKDVFDVVKWLEED